LGEKNTLHIQKVETLWRDAQVVVIGKGLSPGDRIIISDLAAPVEGMRVMLKEPNISKAGGGGDA
jgi:hypothetical protein